MENKSFEMLPAIEPKTYCTCCGNTSELHLSLDTILYNCFGGWHITKDGVHFFTEDRKVEVYDSKRLRFIEDQAAQDPDHDWRAVCYTALHGETYQRQNGKWVLVEQNEGFA